MKWKIIIVAYLKEFWSTVEWHFLFKNIFIHFEDINVFVLCKLATWWRHQVDSLNRSNTDSMISLEIFVEWSSSLAPSIKVKRVTKWYLLCHCHDNSFASYPFYVQTEIPSFFLNQKSSTPKNLLRNLLTEWELRLLQAGPSVPILRVSNWDICF